MPGLLMGRALVGILKSDLLSIGWKVAFLNYNYNTPRSKWLDRASIISDWLYSCYGKVGTTVGAALAAIKLYSRPEAAPTESHIHIASHNG